MTAPTPNDPTPRKDTVDPGSPLFTLLPLLGRRGEDIEPGAREFVFRLVGDDDAEVRRYALRIAERIDVGKSESRILESLLALRGDSRRRGVLHHLLRQADDAVLTTIARLLKSPDQSRRLGGLELLRRMIDSGRAIDQCRAVAAPWKQRKDQLSAEERQALDPPQP